MVLIKKINFKYFKDYCAHTRQHARNIRETFPLKCWSPSDDGHHWTKYVKP
jgi:hypothetical protein